jgi:hypothetical protein
MIRGGMTATTIIGGHTMKKAGIVDGKVDLPEPLALTPEQLALVANATAGGLANESGFVPLGGNLIRTGRVCPSPL